MVINRGRCTACIPWSPYDGETREGGRGAEGARRDEGGGPILSELYGACTKSAAYARRGSGTVIEEVGRIDLKSTIVRRSSIVAERPRRVERDDRGNEKNRGESFGCEAWWSRNRKESSAMIEAANRIVLMYKSSREKPGRIEYVYVEIKHIDCETEKV
ncbi:hypothetical protein KM043_007459 [Ampulex compressa]|nr:hypothetical protein KM043_007459 [Ampulex compressa]